MTKAKPTPEMLSLSRVRSLCEFLRTGKAAEQYPHIAKMTPTEIDDAKKFANGTYPRPARWTLRLYQLAKGK